MRAPGEDLQISIIRPRETSLLLRYQGTLSSAEIARGLEIDRWIKMVRSQAARIAHTLGRETEVHEVQIFQNGGGVPAYERRKRVNASEVLIVIDPSDLMFTYLEEEPLRLNPVFVPIIAALRSDLSEIRREAAHLPHLTIMELDGNDELAEIEEERFETLNLRDRQLLPAVLKRAMLASA